MQNMLQRSYVIHASLAYIGNFPFFFLPFEMKYALYSCRGILSELFIPGCHELSIYLLTYDIAVLLNEDTVFLLIAHF